MLIRPATINDVQGISRLLAKYYFGRLTDAQKVRGFISVEFATEEIESMVRSPGMVVAVAEDREIAAVAGSSPVPSTAVDGVFHKIDSIVAKIKYNARLLSDYRLCLYGPVCVDEASAGQGLSAKLWQRFKEMVGPSYDVGLAFVSVDNTASLNVHRAKLGMKQVSEFEVEGRRYVLLAFDILA
jgi:hypothetical protein